MNLHEYQAKELLQKFGIPTSPFQVIESASELPKALDALGVENVVVKVQIHAGGRGKAGGVKLAKSREEAQKFSEKLLGLKIVNNQTGKEGIVVEKLLITPTIEYTKEYYVGAIIDRKEARPLLIASPFGGMEIEEIAKTHPESILKIPIQLDGTVRNYHLIELAKFMGWTLEQKPSGISLIKNLAKAFMELDASLLEINPLVLLKDNTFLALDAKLAIDDNALFRHTEIAESFDTHQISSLEAMAQKNDLAYIALEGTIGCMVNGAGLAMATMDIIEYYGGKPANFLDVGGGASQEKVAQGFHIILSDPKVKAILVNIFGGIMNCETLAKGIIAAANEQTINVPLIVRMEGTNVEEGKALLKASGLKIEVASSLAEAAELSVKRSKA